ncbi:uncharacterized protein LOC120133850 [Hibiscus syriacus]|uniref:uncharacterized protein LOC120133850 n=1 Tax=Hibiscus syriacus TaxID=106335 RepID=UPI001920EFB2|nr:uncharacterized protein LOC120133850 [Hibiscus syriacus]
MSQKEQIPRAQDTHHPHNTRTKKRQMEARMEKLEENMSRLQKELEDKMAQNNQSTLESIKKNQESLVDQIVAKLSGLQQASAPRAGSFEGLTIPPTSQVVISPGVLPEDSSATKGKVALPGDSSSTKGKAASTVKIQTFATIPDNHPDNYHNPLPNHQETGINAVTIEKGKRVKLSVSEVKAPLVWVWSQMVKAGLLALYPDTAEMNTRKEIQKKRERRLARLTGSEFQREPMVFPPLYHTFKSGGYVFETTSSDLEVALKDLNINVVTTEDADNANKSEIYPLPPGFVPSNWDIKASNVLLDSDLIAKLGDIGLARIVSHEKALQSTKIGGTFGCMALEYALTDRASQQADVYNFGIVILGIVSGRKSILPNVDEDRIYTVEWLWGLYARGKLIEAADPRLEGKYDEQQMERLMILGLYCAHPPALRFPAFDETSD